MDRLIILRRNMSILGERRDSVTTKAGNLHWEVGALGVRITKTLEGGKVRRVTLPWSTIDQLEDIGTPEELAALDAAAETDEDQDAEPMTEAKHASSPRKR